jgi:hypothetical protein
MTLNGYTIQFTLNTFLFMMVKIPTFLLNGFCTHILHTVKTAQNSKERSRIMPTDY